MWHLFYKAFESWCIENNDTEWSEELSPIVNILLDSNLDKDTRMETIHNSHLKLSTLKERLDEFQDQLSEKPTAVFWLIFLKMCDILLKFIYYEREGDWYGHLCESANMLPYLTAAGHYKYGQQSLPQYLYEMKQLETVAPSIHQSFL